MRTSVAAVTPLRVRWPHPVGFSLARNIRIIERPLFIEKDWDFWNFRRTERTDVLNRSHWLCVESECEFCDRQEVLSELADSLRIAVLGLQLWCLKGWDGIIIETQSRASDAAAVERVRFAEPYPMSQWSKMMDLASLDLTALTRLVEGTFAAFESREVRIINPFQFLELGLQTAFNHVRGGALFWTMGLDALLAAERQDRFASRLIRLLGKDRPVFPEDALGRRPTYTVGDVAASMYDLRNLIAHGKEVLEKYRKPIQFQFEPADLGYLQVENWTYETLLFESSLFSLVAALRELLGAGRLDLIKDKRAWEQWLDS